MSKKAVRQLEERLVANESEIVELRTANEQMYSDYSLLQRRFEDWNYIGINGESMPGLDTGDPIPFEKRLATLGRLRRLRHENPLAKQAIKLALRFTLGKGVAYSCSDSATGRLVDEFWKDPVNQAVYTSKTAMTRRFDETLTDGEVFLALFVGEGVPYVRMGKVKAEQIVDIVSDPDNDEAVVWYVRKYRVREWDPQTLSWKMIPTAQNNGMRVRFYLDYRITDEMLTDIESRGLVIPEGLIARVDPGDPTSEPVRIYHRMVNEAQTTRGTRGISELFASREWFRVFKEFMEDRGAINAMANALTYQRRVKGGPAALGKVSGTLGGRSGIPTDQPLTPLDALRGAANRPAVGSIIDSTDNVDWKSIRADTGALHARADAELLLQSGGAGTNTSIAYFGGSSGALAAAQVMELPMVKGFEDYQEMHRAEFGEVIGFVLSRALGREPSEQESQIAWTFPPIITQDVVKWMSAASQLTQQVAPKNRAVARIAIETGLATLNVPNREMAMTEIDKEQKRLADQEDEDRKVKLDQQKKALEAPTPLPGQPGGGVPGSAPNARGNTDAGAKAGGDGSPRAGQRAGGGPQGVSFATSPDLARAAKGKAPKEAPTGPRSRRQ